MSELPSSTTPMMRQWFACKEAAKDCLLLFRMGDFYESFYEDAALLSKELGLALTKRQDIPMSGIPYHTVETYIDELIQKGYRVAIAEQTEEAEKTKGLVHREIARIITPGTVITGQSLNDQTNNFFASITVIGKQWGLAFIDLSTSGFYAVECQSEEELLNELFAIQPSEILTHHRILTRHRPFFDLLAKEKKTLLNPIEDWVFHPLTAETFLLQHFQVQSLQGFGLQGMTAACAAAGALLHHIQNTLTLPVQHICCIQPYSTSGYVLIDRTTQKNLELTQNLQDHSRRNTLLAILDHTNTPMGARLLKRWIKQPLLSPQAIQERQDGVQLFLENPNLQKHLSHHLSSIRDLERLTMRIETGYASPRDLVALRYSLEPIELIHKSLLSVSSPFLQHIRNRLTPQPEITHLLAQALVDQPPLRLHEGGIIRQDFHPELDELRSLQSDNQKWIQEYQEKLRDSIGIKTLKVGFNRMFGYYIEVSKGQTHKMPDTFERKQTLVNAERYISSELKAYETKILTAEEKALRMENELFHALRQHIIPHAKAISESAKGIAEIDCLLSFSLAAFHNRYVRPIVHEGNFLEIQGGRHPIIEAISPQIPFIPNDTLLNDQDQQMIILTGPNMAGKSTYIRQVALITVMAHIGSFVPADTATIGVVDRIFTRLGASDDLTKGQSTFMLEMAETAHILRQATSRSLVILDEIGRGTSTYDGISIAWSVAEYLATTSGKQAKTLFATHYGELTQLEHHIPSVKNYRVCVQESEDDVLFLRKIIPGGADKSYGIHVAKLAALPPEVIARAREILEQLEQTEQVRNQFSPKKTKKTSLKSPPPPSREVQLTFFSN